MKLWNFQSYLQREGCFVSMFDNTKTRHMSAYGTVLHSEERLIKALQTAHFTHDEMRELCKAWWPLCVSDSERIAIIFIESYLFDVWFRRVLESEGKAHLLGERLENSRA
jgi:hypothetical protein